MSPPIATASSSKFRVQSLTHDCSVLERLRHILKIISVVNSAADSAHLPRQTVAQDERYPDCIDRSRREFTADPPEADQPQFSRLRRGGRELEQFELRNSNFEIFTLWTLVSRGEDVTSETGFSFFRCSTAALGKCMLVKLTSVS